MGQVIFIAKNTEFIMNLLNAIQEVFIRLPQQILLEKLELYKMKIQLKIAREKIILKKSNFLIMF